MKTLYEAANGIEAHMIVDLLVQEGISARTDGEYLQGAVGGLPATGIVRVMVDEDQYAAGRGVIDRWNATQPDETVARKPQKPPARWPYVVGGLVIGIAATYAYVRTPISQYGVDHNGDGVLDDRWMYSAAGRFVRAETDRNLDGKVDMISHYDAKGLMVDSEADDDFDGTFEVRTRFRLGNAQVSTSDTDGDGFEDMRTTYVYGVVSTTEYLEPRSGRTLKIEHFRLGKITHADVDVDADGLMDRRVTYDRLGEILKVDKIAR